VTKTRIAKVGGVLTSNTRTQAAKPPGSVREESEVSAVTYA